MIINIVYENSGLSAPQSFRDGIQQAVNILTAAYDDNITVNIQVGYDTYRNQTFAQQGFSSNISVANANTVSVDYTELRDALNHRSTTADDAVAVNSLGYGTTLGGKRTWNVGTAEARALGLYTANNNLLDGFAGFSSTFTGNVLVAGALHELTHALGRIAGQALDLFRYNAPGVHEFNIGSVPTTPAAPAYFSIDGGFTNLANFGRSSDPGDFLNDDLSGNDPDNENVGNNPTLTALDSRTLDVMGYHRAGSAASPYVNDEYAANTSTTGFVAVGGQAYGYLNTQGDQDWFRMSLRAGHHYILRESGVASLNYGTQDPYLRLYNSAGTLALQDDDSGPLQDSLIILTANTTGNYFLSAGGFNDVHTGSYRVSVTDTANIHSDVNGNGTSDLILQNGGTVVDWILGNDQAAPLSGNLVGANVSGWLVVGSGDFNGDGISDVLLQNGATIVQWRMNSGGTVASGSVLGAAPGWTVRGTGDFNNDGVTDVLLQNGGTIVEWSMQNGAVAGGTVVAAGIPDWSVVGTGDINGDGTCDVFLTNGTALVASYLQGGTAVFSNFLGNLDPGWTVVGAGDFNGDGTTDVLLQNGGTIVDWLISGNRVTGGNLIGAGLSGWHVAATGDYNGDGICDVILQTGSTVVEYLMGPNGTVAQGNLIGNSVSFGVLA